MILSTRLFRLLTLVLMAVALASPATLKVGSKKFTESVILGELITQHLNNNGIPAVHKDQLGGTRLLWQALLQGDLDIYPDYTGTIIYEILQAQHIASEVKLRSQLRAVGVEMTAPLGFNNTYALGVSKATAARYKLQKISDLVNYPTLSFGFTNEFMDREDGWPSLQAAYDLPQVNVRGLDHDLAYKGLETGSVDLIDLYSTDAEIAYYNIQVLKDNQKHFPEYQAVILYRTELLNDIPKLDSLLGQLSTKISNVQMVQLNSAVKLDHTSEINVAHSFLKQLFHVQSSIRTKGLLERLVHATGEHLFLVLISLSGAILVAIPLGIWAARKPRTSPLILSFVGIIQTIPSLALLVFMIPLLGIGEPPALVALFLYSLLPILRNTYSGLTDIPLNIRESATALGLPTSTQLRVIELPLAARSILAGIKTSAVINVGTATLGALIGAGGYGQAILTGIRLDDRQLHLPYWSNGDLISSNGIFYPQDYT